MSARNFVLAYVASNPAAKTQIIACIESGLGWADIKAIIVAAS